MNALYFHRSSIAYSILLEMIVERLKTQIIADRILFGHFGTKRNELMINVYTV